MNDKMNIEQVFSDSTEQIKKDVQEQDLHEIRKIAVEIMQKTKIF